MLGIRAGRPMNVFLADEKHLAMDIIIYDVAMDVVWCQKGR